MKKYTTEARPAPKNGIWEEEFHGQLFITERPYYTVKKLDVEILTNAFRNESKLLFGKVVPFFFDEEGRWWAHPSLCSKEMLQMFIQNPLFYFQIIAHKIATVRDQVMPVVKEIMSDLDTIEPQKLASHLTTLVETFTQYYSYHFITYILFDELVLHFRKLLETFLTKKESNLYFSQFLQAEITKAAMEAGAIGETTTLRRDVMYSDSKPIFFYREPKLFFDFKSENEVIAKFYATKPSPEALSEFFALRLITPISIQISEEGQYIESKMLCPLMKVTLEKISTSLRKNGLLGDHEDVQDLTKDEIIKRIGNVLSHSSTLVAKGLGVSAGKVKGKAKIIKELHEHHKFDHGDILVTQVTDPSMVVLMGKAGGIICNIGSMVSHPSILSREMGVPCIVRAACVSTGKPVTEILKDGELIHMCGSSGEVHSLEPRPE